MHRRLRGIGLSTILVVLFLIYLSWNWSSLTILASPNDEEDWWTGTAVWKAWRTVSLLNRTLPKNSTSPSPQNQSGSSNWLSNIWAAILIASRSTPVTPIWPLFPQGAITLPEFPNLHIGWLPSTGSTSSPDLGIFRKIWDEMLGTKKPVEPYDDRPSSPEEGMDDAKQKIPVEPSPLHEALVRKAEEIIRKEFHEEPYSKEKRDHPIPDDVRERVIEIIRKKFGRDPVSKIKEVEFDTESDSVIIESKTGHEVISSEIQDELIKYVEMAGCLGKKIIYIIGDPQNTDPWRRFIGLLGELGVEIRYGSGE